MSHVNTKLIKPLLSDSRFRVKSTNITRLRFPSVCPVCLKPGTHSITRKITIRSEYYSTIITIPIHTHPQCFSAIRRNVDIEPFLGDYLLIFGNIAFATLFLEFNHSWLYDMQGTPMLKKMLTQIKTFDTRMPYDYNCPNCGALLTPSLSDHCPTCNYDLSSLVLSPTSLSLIVSPINNQSTTIVCPSCGMKMLMDHSPEKCVRCNEPLI